MNTKPGSDKTSVISGKFPTQEDRSIGFIRSGESAEGERITQNGYISLYGSADIQMGYLWSVSEDEFKWESSRQPGEVCINLYTASAQIEAAIAEIRNAAFANRQIRVTADFYVLAFQSEVERSLAEPYHPQTYCFKDGAFAPAVLERLTICPISSPPARAATGADEADAPERTIPETPRATENVPPTALPRYSMKALVIALWAIAAAIIFHALR